MRPPQAADSPSQPTPLSLRVSRPGIDPRCRYLGLYLIRILAERLGREESLLSQSLQRITVGGWATVSDATGNRHCGSSGFASLH